MFLQYSLKETLCGLSISSCLEKDINNLTILINRSPQVMLLSLDSNEYLINEERITIPLMLSSQSLGVLRPKLVAPQANGFIADRDASLGHQVFNIAVT
jgi:hypothetical protein